MGLGQGRSLYKSKVGPGHPAKKEPKPKPTVEGGPAQAPGEVNTAFGPPPESASTAQKRLQAESEWARIQGDVNTKLYLAALAYGDPTLIGQYGDVVPNPDSALDTVARNEARAKKETGMNRNAANTFFSGMHLDDIKTLGDEAGIKRKQALDEWTAAMTELNSLLAEAEETKNNILSQADIEDLEAFEASQPVPQEEAAAPSGGSGGGSGGVGGGGGGQGKKGGGTGSGGTTAPKPGGPAVGPGKTPNKPTGVAPGKPAKKPKGKK